MKKNLLLYIILVFLLVMNGFFLFKHFGDSDNKVGPQRFSSRNFISDQLEFDAAQLEKFEELDRAHRERINNLRREIRISKDRLFDMAADKSINDSEIDAITTEIANTEKAKGLETFRFFNAVSELCNKDQRKRFKKMIKDGLRRPQGPPPRDRDRRPNNTDQEHRPPPPPRD